MATVQRGVAPRGGPGDPRRATLLELFSDLVFVVALALISGQLEAHPDIGGGLHAVLMLAAVWWVWLLTAVVTNSYDPRSPAMQALALGVTLGSLSMAAAIPTAFDGHGIVFALAYVTIHLGRGVFLILALRHRAEVERNPRRVLFWFALSAVPWILGGLSGGGARDLLWAIALLLDYGVAQLRYPVPWLGRIPSGEYNVTAEHLAERYQQFFIITLGDAILVVGFAFSATDFGGPEVVGFLLAYLGTALLWRIYTHRAGEALSAAIELSRRPERFISAAPITQLVMIAGVVATAAGFKFVVEQPMGHPDPGRVALVVAGPALFLIGRGSFEYEVFGRVSVNRFVGVLALGIATPLLLRTTPLLAGAVTAAVLAGIAVHDTIRSSGRPPEQPTPPF